MGDVTYTPNNAAQAVARARTHTTWQVGYCLNHVWDCLTRQTKSYGLYDANAGWNATTLRRYDKNPPAGAPVYWSGYQHGHIAISVGGGRVRSTDCPTNGRVSELAIADIPKRWPGLTYRGYGLDFAGDWISGIAPQEDDMFSDTDRQTLASIANSLKTLATQEAGRYSSNYNTDSDRFSEEQTDLNGLAAALSSLKQAVADLTVKVNALPKA